MKVIDFSKKGNLVRFFLGDDSCTDYHGDDWNDRPYEHNAGEVYDEFVKGHVDVVFPFESMVLEPKDDWSWHLNSPYCKDDMKARLCPCIVAVNKAAQDDSWEDRFSFWAASDAPGVLKVFFGDSEESVYEAKRKWLAA